MTDKLILDPCCGSRMFWFDKENPLTVFRDSTNEKKRSERLKLSKTKGTHSKSEWDDMKLFFKNTCCKCLGESNLLYVEKDHIVPLYKGGINSIKNIQPLCAKCNSSKGFEQKDYRILAANKMNLSLPEYYKNTY